MELVLVNFLPSKNDYRPKLMRAIFLGAENERENRTVTMQQTIGK